MAPGFSTDFKELVRARTDLVDLIGERVALTARRGGREYVALCPFHDDHNPSLTVSPERQSYKCWSCGEGGDCYSFVMKFDKIGFREALELLARRANIELPREYQPRSPEDRDARERLYELLAWAGNEFHACLLKAPEAEPARQYLRERGFTAETIGKFRIGYHPAGRDWLLGRARTRKFSPAELMAAGLVGQWEESGGYYDYFRERVLFPIRDPQGRVVAFGGRVIPGHTRTEQPKYWNSPEGELFAKSRLLYGFDAAREAIRRSETAVVAEGYTDCILCHQFGVQNVVAVLGVALSEAHVALLKRFARKVVLMLDGDEAGQRATQRTLPRVLGEEVDLRILTLPSGLDPAEFLARDGAAALQERIGQAADAWDYKLRFTIDAYGLDSIDARQRVLDEMLTLLGTAPRLAGSIRERLILSRLAQRVGVDERAVRDRLKEIRRHPPARSQAAASAPISPPKPLLDERSRDDLLECELLEILFVAPEWVETIRAAIGPDDFRNPALRTLLLVAYDLAEAGESPSYGRMTAALEDTDHKRLAARISDRAEEKNIASQLHDEHGAVDGQPRFLRQAIDAVKKRRDRALADQTQRQLAQQEAAGLSEDAKQQLRRLAQHHQKRALGTR